jgi:hypothetical protein
MPIGHTTIAPWLNNRRAACLLLFDDSSPTHARHVMPELQRRSMAATYYIVPGAHWWAEFEAAWRSHPPPAGTELANHTTSHQGVRDVEHAIEELGHCNEVIHTLTPLLPRPRLISFCRPGGLPADGWQITAEQDAGLFERFPLIPRPPAAGHCAGVHLKTADEMLQLLHHAQTPAPASPGLAQPAAAPLDYFIFHGVGGDWHSLPLPEFIRFLDHLEPLGEQIWITNPIAAHKYQRQRAATPLTLADANLRRIELCLQSELDSNLYDGPLTLITEVPAAWPACRVTQGNATTTVAAHDARLTYNVGPIGQVLIEPV